MNEYDSILATAREGFADEAQDLLRQFEQALLAMEQDPADNEATNTAFRAAHTIKGTAGLFGYDAVVAFTHEVESLLDDLRGGRTALNEAVMACLLQSRDQMELLLAEVGGQADPETARRSLALGAELRRLHQTGQAGPAEPDAAAAPAAPQPEAPAKVAATGLAATWHLSLRLGADALRNGLDPLSFIRYLGSLGRLEGVRTLTHTTPELQALDPENCHLGFELRLASEADRTTIEAVFDFLAEDCTLVVLAPDAGTAEYRQLLDQHASQPAEREQVLRLWQELQVPACAELATVVAPSVAAAAVEALEPAPAQDATERRRNPTDRRQGQPDRRGADEARFIRVRADKLDQLVDLIGELVIAGSSAQLVAEQEESPRFAEAAQRIHELVQNVRDGALGLRMVPVGETFARFHRVVRDVCKQLDKQVELQISGADTELDKAMVERIADPLMHLVRNSLDHGMETAAERSAAGKPPVGQLGLHAYHESGAVVIEVSDDGRGLNRERIFAKAVERGLVEAEAELSDEAVHALIFHAGFSTAEQVTNLSGRGVGMDVVKRNVEALRGQITIASTPGRGTTMQIRLPLTLAIIDGFLTSVGGVTYVLPLDLVAECLALPPECDQPDARTAGHFDLRGEVVPFLDIGRFYHHAPTEGARRSIVLVRDGRSRIGLVVERLMGEHQTVIKPLGDMFQEARGLAGSTILGSGEVALILDVPALLELATERLRETPHEAGHRPRWQVPVPTH